MTDLNKLAEEIEGLVKLMLGCELHHTNGDVWYADVDRQGEPVQVHVASGQQDFIAAAVALVNSAHTIISALREAGEMREALEVSRTLNSEYSMALVELSKEVEQLRALRTEQK